MSVEMVYIKAKALFFVLIFNMLGIIKGIYDSSNELFKLPDNFNALLAKEVAIIPCMISTKEAYERCLKNQDEALIIIQTLKNYFFNHLKISKEHYDIYFQHLKSLHNTGDNPDKIMELFACRLVSFIKPEALNEIIANDITTIQFDIRYTGGYFFFSLHYQEIFKIIIKILKAFFVDNIYDDNKLRELADECDSLLARLASE